MDAKVTLTMTPDDARIIRDALRIYREVCKNLITNDTGATAVVMPDDGLLFGDPRRLAMRTAAILEKL